MAFAELLGVRIHYEWSGAENAPVLVFCNSLGTTLEMWEPQMAAFAKHFRVLRYDSRGHGLSSAPPGPYTVEQLADDVVHLLDALKLERVLFCGLSIGGMTGMRLGTVTANRFDKIVLCNTAAKIGTAETWNARIAAVQQGGMKAVASAVIERWLTVQHRATHPSETARGVAMLENANPEGYVASCAAVRDMDQRETIKGIRLPTLVLSGTQDAVTPLAEGRFLAERIPGARFTEVNAAHLSNWEAAEEFNREVMNFLLG
jgi:3-oxoadipate enol-lactonase